MDEGDVLNSMCVLPGTRNVRVGFFGSLFKIAFDASKDFGLSSSGRTRSIASTCGNRSLGTSGVALSLNAWYKENPNLERLADGLKDFQFTNLTPMCQGNFAIFTADLTVIGKIGAGARVMRQIATTNGNQLIGETNVSLGLLLYQINGTTLDLSGLPTTTSLSLGPWPGPNWKVTLEEDNLALIDVDYSGYNEGNLEFREKTHKGSTTGKKAKIVAEHGSFPLVLGDAGANLTFQISTKSDAIQVKEETRDWVPIYAEKKDGVVQKGIYLRCFEGKLLFRLDLKGDFGASTSGLSSIVASTGGRVSIPGTNMLAMINLFRKIQGAQRSNESQAFEKKKRTAREKKLAEQRQSKVKEVKKAKKEADSEKILSAIAQKIRQVARTRTQVKGKLKTDGQASKSKKVGGTAVAATKEDTNGNATPERGENHQEQDDDDDDAPVTLLKRPLLPSKGGPEPLAKKACPDHRETNGKKAAQKPTVSKKKVSKHITKGAAMNLKNVEAAVKAYLKKHPQWTFSLMKEEISEDHEWDNGPKLKMFISSALKVLGADSRGGNVVEGAL